MTIAISKIQSKEELNLHLNKLATILSQAFYNDPYYVHIMPNNKKRTSQIQWWMKILLKYTFKYGAIYVTSDYKGVSMWLGPNKPTLDNIQLALLGLILYPVKIGIRNFFNMQDVSMQWEKAHALQKKNHYYLMVIGVEATLQRKGIGSELIEGILIKADNEKLDCYLETVTAENVMFYKKHNFEIISNKNFGKEHQYWLMKRTPQI